jgi:hypothetical protein
MSVKVQMTLPDGVAQELKQLADREKPPFAFAEENP